MQIDKKEIKFRPLRRVKKNDNHITVASYMQWRRVKTADYDNFNLILINDYKKFSPDEFVYDHKGNQLFYFNFNPSEIPVFNYHQFLDLETIRETNKEYGIRWSQTGCVNYYSKGTDCDGVPFFSHLTADYIATHYNDVTQFEPLTVKMVVFWIGWFIYGLENSNLKTK